MRKQGAGAKPRSPASAEEPTAQPRRLELEEQPPVVEPHDGVRRLDVQPDVDGFAAGADLEHPRVEGAGGGLQRLAVDLHHARRDAAALARVDRGVAGVEALAEGQRAPQPQRRLVLVVVGVEVDGALARVAAALVADARRAAAVGVRLVDGGDDLVAVVARDGARHRARLHRRGVDEHDRLVDDRAVGVLVRLAQRPRVAVALRRERAGAGDRAVAVDEAVDVALAVGERDGADDAVGLGDARAARARGEQRGERREGARGEARSGVRGWR